MSPTLALALLAGLEPIGSELVGSERIGSELTHSAWESLPFGLRLCLVAVGLAALFAALVLWMAGGWQRPRTLRIAPDTLPDLGDRAENSGRGGLRIVTWNIAWGYGFGSEGSGRAKPKDWFDRSLEHIGEVLRSANVDVALLQEVDFGSTRSHHVDQAAVIARVAGLPYVARAPSWRARWVPFPFGPPREHFGRLDSGGAILSRFPITENEVELLPKPAKNALWYNLFYLFRYVQRAELAVGDRRVRLVNVHLEAFDPAARLAQAEQLAKRLTELGARDLVLAGDLNTVPPEQTIRRGYPDEPHTDHEGDRTLEILRAVPGLRDTVFGETFREAETSWFTFPSHAPNRKLDHVLTGPGLEVRAVRVLRDAGDRSDHLPLLVELALER